MLMFVFMRRLMARGLEFEVVDSGWCCIYTPFSTKIRINGISVKQQTTNI